MDFIAQNQTLVLIVAAVLVVAIVALLVVRLVRRRRARADDVPLPSGPIDYTSLPIEEPTSFRDRISRLPLAGKLLLILIPLALIVAGIVVLQGVFAPGPEIGQGAVPTLPVPAIENVRANLSGPDSIDIRAQTNLADGTPVFAEITDENGQPLTWIDATTATTEVRGGRVNFTIRRAADYTPASRDVSYVVTLIAGSGLNEVRASGELVVPVLYAPEFYGQATTLAETPTSLAVVTAAAETPTAGAETPASNQPTAAAQPTTSLPVTEGLTATVFNGGRVRAVPVDGCEVGQINANETVVLLQKLADSSWYRVTNPRNETGWVSATLLNRIDPPVASQVPVIDPADVIRAQPAVPLPEGGLIAAVENGGRVRAEPVDGCVVDYINANETIVLLQKTSDGAWYRLTTVRGASGWSSVSLLNIDPQVASQVPVVR